MLHARSIHILGVCNASAKTKKKKGTIATIVFNTLTEKFRLCFSVVSNFKNNSSSKIRNFLFFRSRKRAPTYVYPSSCQLSNTFEFQTKYSFLERKLSTTPTTLDKYSVEYCCEQFVVFFYNNFIFTVVCSKIKLNDKCAIGNNFKTLVVIILHLYPENSGIRFHRENGGYMFWQ